ncbi:MAG: hypothetical protein ACKVWV_04465 [Planctomycetota bacterium]
MFPLSLYVGTVQTIRGGLPARGVAAGERSTFGFGTGGGTSEAGRLVAVEG